ncbi:glycosyltransferase family 39 protein [uncultured Tenacibaculum sp.]|uniref:glycosyltransferase family 39 protein n=1 Tax=uncultured Tenacibaculum sp. TaxID=174713 RepID=UPI00261035DF|nr:glycosyltransferase family 39 protein [uncultured Tenacibaculum sp.]
MLNYFKKNPVITIIIGFQLFRFILLPFMGLMPQDAYYQFYGENLSFCYFDHPGMIGYFLRFFTTILGKSVFVIKLTDFIITTATLLSFYKLASLFLSKKKLESAMLIIISTFFISILSYNSTPDVPLLLFWTLSILLLYKAIFEEKRAHWICAGVTIGLAFNSKYTAILLPLGLFAFLLFSKKYRKLIISPWLWLSLTVALIISFPVWWWNYHNEFASFMFQSSERTSDISKLTFSSRTFFGAIGHQLLLLLPLLFGIFIFFSFKYIKRFILKFKLPSNKILFLLAFFIPTFFGFLSLAPIYWVKLNWLMPSYITGIIIASLFMSKRLIKYQLIFSMFLHLLIAVQVLFYVFPVKSDDTWVGWEELASEIEKLQEKHPATFVFSNDKYKTTAALNFFMNDRIYAQNVIGLPALHFDYLNDDLSKLNGLSAFYVDSDKRFKNENKQGKMSCPQLPKYFEKYTELEPIIISYNGRKVRKFWVYLCENYNANP